MNSKIDQPAAGNSLPIIEARRSDVPSLTTILPRAFHPTNPYMRRTIPDTPAVRDWWNSIFIHQIKDPNCRTLVCVLDPNQKHPTSSDHEADPNSKDEPRTIAVLCLQFLTASSTSSAGFWRAYPVTADHDGPAFDSMIDAMLEARGSIMAGKAFLSVELFGVDAEFQGHGIGARLIREACKIADEAGCETFVQANHFARAFYERVGFECVRTKVMPGDEGYEECMLIRKPVARVGGEA